MLKLNLILNSLVSSLDHAVQGDTLVAPYHKDDNGKELRTFVMLYLIHLLRWISQTQENE